MSANVPQVLSRSSNGSAATGLANNSGGKGRSRNEAGNSRSRKRRGQRDGKTDNGRGGQETDGPRPPRQRQQNDGSKLVLRRLPPSMTADECIATLGEKWAVGNGKVDWLSFISGKIATDPAKPSRPARCYLNLIRKDDIPALVETIRSATWEYDKTSFSTPLTGPPLLELSIYKKVPSSKKRTDARQGTIDQDPEFMAYLEDLANPTPARDNVDAEDGDDVIKGGDTKVTTTPLVDYLKEKKASKSKDSASGKKRGEGGRRGVKDEDSALKKKGRDSKVEKPEKTEKASKTTIKILTNKTATEQAADAARSAAKAINAAISQDVPKSRRAEIASAARTLQRDLGLSPGNAHRRARQDAAKADASVRAKEALQLGDVQDAAMQPFQTTTTATESKAKLNGGNKGQQSGRRGREAKNVDKGRATDTSAGLPTAANPPVILKKKTGTQVTNTATALVPSMMTASQGNASSKAAAGGADKTANAANINNKETQAQIKTQPASTGATRAFIKNVMYNQGITEGPLRQALEKFGPMTAIEMDKRKAFAYVDFVEHDALVKAIAASPLSIARGSVQIYECRDKNATVSNGSAGVSPLSAAVNKNKIKAGEKDSPKEKGSEPTRRGRRGRGGRGNNGSGGNNNNGQANTAAPPTSAALSAVAATSSG